MLFILNFWLESLDAYVIVSFFFSVSRERSTVYFIFRQVGDKVYTNSFRCLQHILWFCKGVFVLF